MNKQLDDYDLQYIKNIEGVKSFFIPASDFIGAAGIRNKKAIQYLYLTNYFLRTIKRSELLDTLDGSKIQTLNNLINKLKKSPKFDLMYSYTPSGIGPGEILLYFLTNNSTLGGFKTGDLRIGGKVFEVKVGGVLESVSNAIEDIRLANAKGLKPIYYDLIELQNKLNIENKKESIEKSIVEQLRLKGGDEFVKIENEFKQLVQSYFNGKQAVLMVGNTSRKGKVAAIKNILASDVSLHRYTNNEFKARIKI